MPAKNTGTLNSGNRHYFLRTPPHWLVPPAPSDCAGTTTVHDTRTMGSRYYSIRSTGSIERYHYYSVCPFRVKRRPTRGNIGLDTRPSLTFTNTGGHSKQDLRQTQEPRPDTRPSNFYYVRGTAVNRTYDKHTNTYQVYIYRFLLTKFGPIYHGPP